MRPTLIIGFVLIALMIIGYGGRILIANGIISYPNATGLALFLITLMALVGIGFLTKK